MSMGRVTTTMTMSTATSMTATMAKALRMESFALYRLMAWLSPAYPVGAFSYSSGIEWAVEAGDIKDAASLRQWGPVVEAAHITID